MDWEAIKAEYIAGGTSYRKLAVKHSVPFSTLKDRAKREKWTDLKTQAQHNSDTKLIETIGEQNGTYTVKINDVADKLLKKIDETLDMYGEGISGKSSKEYAAALKDIKEIKGIKTEMDLREQEARIDKLRSEIDGDKKDNTIVVAFADEVKRYGN